MNPETRIELAARRSAECVELARWVCLATRIDPALIRRARLTLMRGADAGVESDLWFSPLVQTAGGRYILFYPEVTDLLRRRLASNRDDLAWAWRVTRKTHRGLPELVRLEEKLTWLAVKGGPRLERMLDARLRPLIKAMLTGQREGLGRWALNVLPHMPEGVRESKSARLLRVVAESQLYGGWTNLLTTTGEGPTDEEAALLLHGLERTVAGLRLTGDRLEVSEPPEDYSRLIKVPATNPRVLEVTWLSGDAHEQSRVTWQKGERAYAEHVSLPVTVNTLAGDSHRLVHASEVNLSVPSLVYIIGRVHSPVGMGVGVENNFILTTLNSVWGTVNPNNPDGETIPVRFPYQTYETNGFAKLLLGRRPEGSLTDHPFLLKLEESYGAPDPAKLKSAFDLVGKVLAAPVLMPHDATHRWATFEVGEMTEAGEFTLIPATQIKPEELARWSGAPLINVSTGEVAGVALVREDEGGPRLTLFSLNLITREFPEIFADASSNVLLIYSHRDVKHVERFRVHMKPLGERLVLWSDEMIRPGGNWQEDIARALDEAAAVVLFVSADYLASVFMAGDELSLLLEHAEQRGALILPLIVSASRFERTRLARYQAVNSPSKPLTAMTAASREAVYVKLAKLLSTQLRPTTEVRDEPRTEAKLDFYITHHKADSTWAEWVAWELEEAGYSVVIQTGDFRPGHGLAERAMAEAAHIIFLLSPDYLGSEYTTPEWAAALATSPGETGPRPLPVRVREVTPTGPLGTLKYIDLVGLDEKDARDALLGDIRRVQPQPVRPAAATTSGGAGATFPGGPSNVPDAAPPEPRAPDEFKTDIYISYAHTDDESLDGNGWVSLFAERLPGLVRQYLGYSPRVRYDDSSFRRGDDLPQAADREEVESALLFIAVATPSYVLSEWCRRELEMFSASRPPAGFGEAAPLSRIFKVLKTPLLPHVRDKEPEQLRGLLGYAFYEMKDEMLVEFSPDVSSVRDERYWNALSRLAWEMAKMLTRLKPGGEMPVASSTAAAPSPSSSYEPGGGAATTSNSVYLAETTRDVRQEREEVRRELEQRGYSVLPDKELPLYEPDFDAAVRESLARCRMSIHLFGARYGVIPEGGDGRSVAHRQLELAAERAASDTKFRRVIWLPPGLEPADERQGALVRELQWGAGMGVGTELLQLMLEEFNEFIVRRLAAKP